MKLHRALVVEDGTIRCVRCDSDIADGDANATMAFKSHLAATRRPVSGDPAYTDLDQFVDEQPELVEYCCPHCGVLVDVEVTVTDQPISGTRR